MNSIFASFVLIMLLPLLTNAAPGYGVVTLVKGQVEAINSSGQKRALKIGDKVFESETVITQKQSAARLAMMDTNIIEIYPNSNLKIQQYLYNPKEDQKNVNLEVLQGRIKSTVKQKYDNDKNKYNVKTPVIVAGVRGTTFSAEHDVATLQSRVITFEGNVLVGKREVNDAVKEFFSVKANQSVIIDQRPSAKPEVKELPKVEQEKIKQEDKKDGLASRQQLLQQQPSNIAGGNVSNPTTSTLVQPAAGTGTTTTTNGNSTTVRQIEGESGPKDSTVVQQPSAGPVTSPIGYINNDGPKSIDDDQREIIVPIDRTQLPTSSTSPVSSGGERSEVKSPTVTIAQPIAIAPPAPAHLPAASTPTIAQPTLIPTKVPTTIQPNLPTNPTFIRPLITPDASTAIINNFFGNGGARGTGGNSGSTGFGRFPASLPAFQPPAPEQPRFVPPTGSFGNGGGFTSPNSSGSGSGFHQDKD